MFDRLMFYFAFFSFSIRLVTKDYNDKSIDTQGLAYLAGLLALGLIAGRHTALTSRILFHKPSLVFVIFISLGMISAFGSPTPLFSCFVVLTWLVSYFGVFAFISHYGLMRAVDVYVRSSMLVVLVSLYCYFVYPDLARTPTWQNDELVLSSRLSGVLGHPQTVGQISSAALMMCVLFSDKLSATRGRSAIAGLLILVLGLLLSQSRTAILVLAACTLLWKSFGSSMWRTVAVCSLIVLPVVATAVGGDLTAITRPGDAEEVTSLTGRSDIWAAAAELWLQRPVFGWGPVSLQSLLPLVQNTSGEAAAAPHAHNLVLEVLSTQGIVGLFWLVMVVISAAAQRTGFRSELRLLMLFVLLWGLTEAVPLGARAGEMFLLFCFCVAGEGVPHLEDLGGRERGL